MKKAIIAVMAFIVLFSCVANANLCDNGVQVLSSVEGDALLEDLDFITGLILSLVFSLLLFLLLREIVCWYFKFNKIVSLLEELNDNIYDMRRNKKVDFDENEENSH